MRVNNRNLPEILRYLRVRKGMSRATLSRMTGVSVSGIFRYENGERSPNITTLWKLLDVLKADIEITY